MFPQKYFKFLLQGQGENDTVKFAIKQFTRYGLLTAAASV